MRNPSFNWEKLQNVFYRCRNICDLEWPKADENVKYAISTTLIATKTDETIQVYEYTGTLLCRINTERFGQVIAFEFNSNEHLIIVTPNALKIVKNWKPFEIESVPLDIKIEDSIWSYKNGIAILKESQDIYIFDHVQKSLQLLCKNKSQYTLLTKEHWQANDQLLLILDINHVFELNIITGGLKKSITNSQWHRVDISSEGFICLFNAKTNKLMVCREPNQILLEHYTDKTPISIKWCGNDAIACSFKDEVKIYGPSGKYINFWFHDDIVTLHSEIDGLKVFTSTQVHFISRVPDCSVNIFRVGSTEPAAILVDSMNMLSTHAPKSLENLKAINLKQAVLDCIKAAQDEFDPQWQKLLLNSASFGKSSLEYRSFDSNMFVEACDTIKLLNILRSFGLFLSFNEYKNIGFEKVLNMLLSKHKFYESFEICKKFQFTDKFNKIFYHWAITKIKVSVELEDDELLNIIKDRLSSISEMVQPPMVQIAHVAYLEGRFTLTRELALLEKRPEHKITELLELEDNELAMKEALLTRNPELILSLLLRLSKNVTPVHLTKLIMMNMSDYQLYPYFNKSNHEYLFDYFRQTDSFIDLAKLVYEDGKETNHVDEFLPQIKDLYSKNMNDLLFKREISDIERQDALNKYQETLSIKYTTDFEKLTINETLGKLVEINQEKQINDFKKMFGINEKKYYHIAVRKMIELKEFQRLFKFVTSKRSPIGYNEIYKYLFQTGNKLEASKYIEMIPNMSYNERKKRFLDCKNYEALINIVENEKDIAGLKEIYKVIPPNQPLLKQMVTEAMSRI